MWKLHTYSVFLALDCLGAISFFRVLCSLGEHRITKNPKLILYPNHFLVGFTPTISSSSKFPGIWHLQLTLSPVTIYLFVNTVHSCLSVIPCSSSYPGTQATVFCSSFCAPVSSMTRYLFSDCFFPHTYLLISVANPLSSYAHPILLHGNSIHS